MSSPTIPQGAVDARHTRLRAKVLSAALGAVALIAGACAVAPASPTGRVLCDRESLSIQIAIDDTGGVVPPGSVAMSSAVLANVRAGEEFGLSRLSGKAGVPVSTAPGQPCADDLPAKPELGNVAIGDPRYAEAMAEYGRLLVLAEESGQAVQAWRQGVTESIAALPGADPASTAQSDLTGVCAQDGWPVEALSRVSPGVAPMKPVLVLSGCQAAFVGDQPKLPEGIFEGVSIVIVGAVGDVDADHWFSHTRADVTVVRRDRPGDLPIVLDGLREDSSPAARAAAASANAASMLPLVLSIPAMLGDAALIAALGLIAGLVILTAYGILGAIFLDPLLSICERCRRGMAAVLRWGTAFNSALRRCEAWSIASGLRVRAAGGGDIAEDILQGRVLFATIVCGFALIAVGAGLVGMFEIPGVRGLLPWILGGTVVLSGAFAFHQVRRGPANERPWALLAVALALAAVVLIAVAKGADLLSQQGLRQALSERRTYDESALIGFLRKSGPFLFIATASAQVLVAGALTDFKVLGRFAAFLAGTVLATLLLLPLLAYFTVVAIPVAALLGAIFVPVALLAVFPAKVREWVRWAWAKRTEEVTGPRDEPAVAQPPVREEQPAATKRKRAAEAVSSEPTGGMAIF